MSGRRVLVTDAEQFVGPAAVERLGEDGDDVVARSRPFESCADVAACVGEHGPFDVVVANLDAPITVASIVEHDDAVIAELHARLVAPLYWLFAVCLPPMIDAGDGDPLVTAPDRRLRGGACGAAPTRTRRSPSR